MSYFTMNIFQENKEVHCLTNSTDIALKALVSAERQKERKRKQKETNTHRKEKIKLTYSSNYMCLHEYFCKIED